MNLLIAIEDINRSFNDEMSLIAGHFLVCLYSGVQLIFPAIGLGCSQVNTGRRRIVRVNVILKIIFHTRCPSVTIELLRPGIRLENERLNTAFTVFLKSYKFGAGLDEGGYWMSTGVARRWQRASRLI